MSNIDDERIDSWMSGGNASFVEQLYEQFLSEPALVGENWRHYFEKWQSAGEVRDIPRLPIEAAFRELNRQPVRRQTAGEFDEEHARRQINVLRLISAHRVLGVKSADLDPLKRMAQALVPELDPAHHGFSESDYASTFSTNIAGMEKASLAEIIAFLRQTYCEKIGVEYMHITTSAQKNWVRDWFESCRSTPHYSDSKKQRILRQITAAETLEQYLHRRYVGQKRFSLEGGESLIAALDHLVQYSGDVGIQEVVLGMAHRGRLNVLVNVLGKQPADLFSEFEGKQAVTLMSGDVKYHMGFSADVQTELASVHLSLAFNPSHLEIVNPVVEGSVRARQHRRGDTSGQQVLPVLIHGDAAFIGLGTNQGTFNLSQTRGYKTGGTVHLVINNQIGFTTSDPRDNRSSIYCTDIAKMVEAPIFHVNGDDPEAVCLVTQAALEYRNTFHKDVVIDIVCFRKHGHNEADDPFVTQPMMYKKITHHPGVRQKYADRLVNERIVQNTEADALITQYRAALDRGEHVKQATLSHHQNEHAVDFTNYKQATRAEQCLVATAVTHDELQALACKLTTIPPDFKLRPTVEKEMNERALMASGERNVNWGMAETLAYASLVSEGFDVRLSGEDCGRGTFSHRHAVLHDQNREKWDQGSYIPLQNLSEKQGSFTVIDSILNEEAVLAFEYGYATSAPNSLVIWEGQFGDFANGGQVVIDQFIASGESKWGRLCGLVMFLPHGYDGQGPEHSSARIERYLQLCADDNMTVVMMSESSQMFHILRRQMRAALRKPLVVIMSKRLLRYKDSMSPISAFTKGQFLPVIGERNTPNDAAQIEQIVICAGQIYYDLFEERNKKAEQRVVLIRVEQLYPFPEDALRAELEKYPHAKHVVWAQEEPRNQGAWYQIRHHLEAVMTPGQLLRCAARPASASPAVGYASLHQQQLATLLTDALTIGL